MRIYLIILFLSNITLGFEPSVINGIGIEMHPPTVAQLLECKLESSYGVGISRIHPASFATRIGLKENDLLISINNNVIYSMRDVRRNTDTINSGDVISLLIYRNGKPILLYGKYFLTPVTVVEDFDDQSELNYRSWTNKSLERRQRSNESLHRTIN